MHIHDNYKIEAKSKANETFSNTRIAAEMQTVASLPVRAHRTIDS